MDKDLFEFKLIYSGIDNKCYNANKALYKTPAACLQLNSFRTGWFPSPFWVKQGDVLSPSL